MGDKHGSGGFLLGLLIGGAVGAMISTKKGRQILRDVADYGIEYIGNTVSMKDFEGIFDQEEEVVDGFSEKTADEKKVLQPEHVIKENSENHEESKRKKFFKGIGKK